MVDAQEFQAGPGALSTQINIVTTIDVAGVLQGRPIEDCVWMTDNSQGRSGRGTSALQSVCQPGQVINWLTYSLDVEQRPDGSYPPVARIVSIVFFSGDLQNPVPFIASQHLRVYGAPDRMRSPYTPVYAYWAGMIPTDADSTNVRYRLNIEIPSQTGGRSTFAEVSQPSLAILG